MPLVTSSIHAVAELPDSGVACGVVYGLIHQSAFLDVNCWAVITVFIHDEHSVHSDSTFLNSANHIFFMVMLINEKGW